MNRENQDKIKDFATFSVHLKQRSKEHKIIVTENDVLVTSSLCW